MARFYLPPDQCRGEVLHLSGGEAHHALHVLRIRAGELVQVLDGAGHELSCSVSQADRDRLELHVTDNRFTPPPPLRITLLQALPKGKLIDSIVQKATELGVSHIIPVISERVVSRLDPNEARERGEKLQQVAIEAIKQCGAPWLPKVSPPTPLRQVMDRLEPFELSLVGSLQPGSRHPREYLDSFFKEHRRLPTTVGVWVGPEGDFAPGEINAIQAGGALPISLGPLVLRSETAALYCLSFLQYESQFCNRTGHPVPS